MDTVRTASRRAGGANFALGCLVAALWIPALWAPAPGLAVMPLPPYRAATAAAYEKKAQNCLLTNGTVPACLEPLELAVKLDPRRVSAQRALGTGYFLTGQGERAVAPLARVLELDPTQDDVLLLLGRIYGQQGRPGPARQKLEAYLERHPDSGPGLLELASLLASQGQRESAYSFLERALKADATLARQVQQDGRWARYRQDPLLVKQLGTALGGP